MSREIRRVPPDWQHPRFNDYDGLPHQIGRYRPLMDADYVTASMAWIERGKDADFLAKKRKLWRSRTGKSSLQAELDHGCENIHTAKFFWEDDPPPDPECYRARAWSAKEATHFQVYETVSEGTPVTPVFATLQDLEDYLVEVGEMAGTSYCTKYSRNAARVFCREQWAPSLISVGGEQMSGVEGLARLPSGDNP